MAFGRPNPEHPKVAAPFYDLMELSAARRYSNVSSVLELSGASQVVDVGGGEGSLLVQVLKENPHLKGILFDLPVVSGRARERITTAGFVNRCEIIAGDFRERVPSGGDVYILAQILNNWRDADARIILSNCRTAMRPGARLLVLEAIFSPGPLSRWRTLVSLGVMAQRGGRTRSESQLRTLIANSGFRIDSIQRLPESETYAVNAEAV
ncbi:MAG: methyltransferase [Polyangiaceae bacterium]